MNIQFSPALNQQTQFGRRRLLPMAMLGAVLLSGCGKPEPALSQWEKDQIPTNRKPGEAAYVKQETPDSPMQLFDVNGKLVKTIK